jgi:dihydroorotate dehydrogenase (NAD+) catalytic subunit
MLKYELYLSKPLMNAAGTLGFAPRPRIPFELAEFGAFVTNPVSMAPRTPAYARCYLPFSGGFLLHSGYPNPGIRGVLRRYAARWSRSSLPVIVHLLAHEMREVVGMIEHLESLEGVMAVELSIPPGASEDLTYALVSASTGEMPVIAQLPIESAAQLAEAAVDAGANALSLSPPRGILPDALGKFTAGRLYGPSLFPHAMLVLQTLISCGVPVIAAGGFYHADQVQAALNAGAAAIQLDAVLWRGGWSDTG